MHDPVDHGRGDHLVAEDAAPGREGEVAREDQRGPLVARGDQLEEEVGGVLVEGQVADLVDDEQAVTGEAGEFARELAEAKGTAVESVDKMSTKTSAVPRDR